MKLSLVRLVILVTGLLLGAGVATGFAQDLGAVKARMRQRIPQVDQLKEKGAVGENNRGFLEVRGGAPDAAAIVAAENQDRQTVYAAIAARVGATPDEVGRKRASRIAAASAPGVWLQLPNGTWYRK